MLTTNAYHAVEDSGGQISIKLKQRELEGPDVPGIDLSQGTYAVLSVSDTGSGMSEDLIGKIFDPYFTTKEQGKGTGLGLALVYGIVKEFGGDIKVYSEIGKGSTFEIYLPLMAKSNGPESTPEAENYLGGNERVLLIDDEKAVVKLEKQMLERLGYQVTAETSSSEVLNIFSSNPEAFDLVISDMAMPNMTGDQLARELLAVRPDIPIVICTGFSEKIDGERAHEIGVKGFLMKPVVKSEMAKMVRKVLDEAKGANQG